jgi:hypothetical protein
MGLTNFEQMLVDSNGNYYGVSASMVLPLGAIGQLVAGVDANTGLVQWLSLSNGAVVITGSIATSVVFPSSIGVFSTSPSGFWSAGPEGVSGSQLSGSTFNGFPVVGGGVYYGSGNVGSLPAFVRALQTDVSGALYVTVTGSIPVTVAGTVNVDVTNFPAVQPVSFTQPVQVWSEGPTGVTGSVNVYTSGPQSVSSSSPSGFWFAGTVGVSGSYQSGSVATAPVFPVLEGGVDTNNVVHPFLTDTQGRLTNPTTGSNVTSVAASVTNQTALFPNNQRCGAVFWNEGKSVAYLKFGIVATLTSYTVQLGTNGYYELPFTYQGRVDVIFNGIQGNLRITELT